MTDDRSDVTSIEPEGVIDAPPRIDVDTSEPGVRRISVRDDADVRPGVVED